MEGLRQGTGSFRNDHLLTKIGGHANTGQNVELLLLLLSVLIITNQFYLDKIKTYHFVGLFNMWHGDLPVYGRRSQLITNGALEVLYGLLHLLGCSTTIGEAHHLAIG